MSKVRLKIDIVQGTLEVDCNSDDFEEVISSAERVLQKYSSVTKTTSGKGIESEVATEASHDSLKDADPAESPTKPKPKAKRRKGGGHANWKVVEDLLNENQRSSLKAFYEEKSPTIQNHQVAVLAYMLSELLGRDGFDGHEIHTAFQAVGAKTPANLTGVFGNMAGEDLGKVVDKKWTPNFKSSDLVKHDLPVPQKG